MPGRKFLDTNVFVYSVDESAPARKRDAARALVRSALEDRNGVVSYQVIQEFVNVASRKFKVPLKSADITDFIDGTFRRMHVVHSSFELFHSALGVQTRYRLSWFDSILVAAGAESGCSVLFSEDLHDGAKFGSLRVANPFGPKAR